MTYEEKVKNLVNLFSNCKNSEEKYIKIISFNRYLKKLDSIEKNSQNKVEGCQSQTYFSLSLKQGKISFNAASDALITQGLAGILIYLFQNELPEKALKENFKFLEELQIQESLSVNRSNGLRYMIIHLKANLWKWLNHQ